MINETRPTETNKEDVSRLKHRIETLEHALQQALNEKSALDAELREIKNSFAWMSILKYRGLRDRLLPLGTRRRHAYDLLKPAIRTLISPETTRYDVSHGAIPRLASEAFNTPGAGSLDHPAAHETVRREPLWVTGWAVLSAPLARVDITIDGLVHGCARPGVYRPDLAKFFPGRPDALVAGFEYLLDLVSLPRECNALTVGALAYSMDGSQYELPAIPVRVAAQEPADENYNARSTRLRKNVERSGPVESKTEKETIRLLIFTHHLGYGGGQLYLYELLRRLSCQDGFTATVVAPDDGPLRSAIEDLGIPVHLTCGYPHQNIEMFEAKVDELVAWARPQGFNAIMVNTVVALPGPEVAIRLGIPFVWAIHESWQPSVLWSVVHPSPGAHPQVRRRVTDALSKAAALVFEADATRRLYQSYGDPERSIVVPYGIDVDAVDRYKTSFDRAAARRRLGIPRDATGILCMSTIEPRKAQILLAEAFQQVVESHPEAFLILVGDTGFPYANVVRSYVAEAGLQQRVLISAVVPDPYEWYGSADLLVCPSDVESMPRCVIEAMAFEVPVLATEVFGVPELIKDGETGYLCRPCDLAALALALKRVLSEDKENRRQVARNGSNLVRTRHDSRGYANTYLRLLRGLIRDARATPGDLLTGQVQVEG